MSAKQQQCVTAFVYDRRGRLLSVGRNSYTKTHRIQAEAALKEGKPNAIYLHAEVAALVKIKDWNKAFKLVVTRYTKDGKPALAKPCSICQRVIRETGIKVIEHT